jgi:hypothetical protein
MRDERGLRLDVPSRPNGSSKPRAWHGAAPVSTEDADLVVVAGEVDARGMVAYLLSTERAWPVVGLGSVVDGEALVADPGGVRLRLGQGPRIYAVAGREELEVLRELLGAGLSLRAGAARVWWPGMSLHSDSRDHPLVSRVDDEDDPAMLAEITGAFDLSRPAVRREICVIEELRAMLEHELALERSENRDLKIEREQALARAEAAEAQVTRLTGRLEQQVGSTDRGQDAQ